MNSHASHLLAPLSFDGLDLANRIVMSPMTRARAGREMIANDLMGQYYAQRSSAGLIISEGTFVSKQAVGWVHAPGIWSDKQVEGWKEVTSSVHAHGTPMFLQLWHTGRASHEDFHDGAQPVAPSAVRHEGGEIRTPSGEKKSRGVPRALETDEVPGIVEDYRQAAENAHRAGFDGVEIHAANGYLIDQFLQSTTNEREDRYGGSIENRYQFLREIVDAVCGVWPQQRVAVRLSPNGNFNDMGSRDYREQFTYVIQQLDQYELAFLDVIDGLAFGFHELGEPMTLKEIRGFYKGRLMGNCGYVRDDAESQIAEGHADLIAFGRPFISNPDLVERFANGWDFNEPAPQETWYSGGAKGYVDFPAYQEAQEEELTKAVRS